MIIRYNYACTICAHEYIEQRKEEENQYFVKCQSCFQGEFALVNKIQLKNFAAISNNQVVQLVLFETKDDAEKVTNLLCVEYTDDNPLSIDQILDGKTIASSIEERNKKITLQELAAQQAAEAEAKRLADQEAQRTADMGKISNLPKVKGTFVSEGE
jgi:hypothetical protein